MRVFLTRRAGTGAAAIFGAPADDPFRPDVDFALFPGVSWASWDIEHPDTDAVIGYVVAWSANSAPIGAIADLGDPTDRQSFRTAKIGNTAATTILDEVYGPGNWNTPTRNVLANRSGAQVIKWLNRRDPVMAASWGDTIAELVDETDTAG